MVGCGSREIFENINVNLVVEFEEIDLHSNIFAFSGKLHGRRSALAKLVSNLVHICSHQVDRQDGQDVLRPPRNVCSRRPFFRCAFCHSQNCQELSLD